MTESLAEFAERQRLFVIDTAKKAHKMLDLDPDWDVEKWFNKTKRNIPMLRHFTFREFEKAIYLQDDWFPY